MTPDEAVRIVRQQTIPALAGSGGGGHVEALRTVLAVLVDAQARLVEMYERIIPEEIAKGCAAERRESEWLRRGLIVEAEADIRALGFEAHPAVTMRMDRLVRASRKEQKP